MLNLTKGSVPNPGFNDNDIIQIGKHRYTIMRSSFGWYLRGIDRHVIFMFKDLGLPDSFAKAAWFQNRGIAIANPGIFPYMTKDNLAKAIIVLKKTLDGKRGEEEE